MGTTVFLPALFSQMTAFNAIFVFTERRKCCSCSLLDYHVTALNLRLLQKDNSAPAPGAYRERLLPALKGK